MKLYHGSNIAVSKPEILVSDRRLDFGTGFYLTTSSEQAQNWSELTVKRKGSGTPTVSIFEFDNQDLSGLKCLKFPCADKDWLRFVAANRKNENIQNDYDLIIGPVANDRTMPVISLYFAGIYDEDETIRRLLPQMLRDQYVFRSELALQKLIFVKAVTK
jgi:hypothetical protein